MRRVTRPPAPGQAMTPETAQRLRLELATALQGALYADPKPRSLADAVSGMRRKARWSAWEFGQRCGASHVTISALESGRTRGSGELLDRMADVASDLHMGHTANFLRLKAMDATSEFYKRGGKR